MRFKILFLFFFLPWICFAEIGYVEPWGTDSSLCTPQAAVTPAQKLSPMARIMEQIILFHHNVVTQIDGPRSHFRPSSSHYMLGAIRKHGFFRGFIMGCDRLLRENEDPWIYRTKIVDGKRFKWDPPR